jgi:N-acetyl-alpha-D-muramate 1-phosphate uridylyltransferase
MSANLPVALLAGGLATRLRPVTETIPKSLVEVAGRPFVEHQLALLARHGITRVVLCLGHLGEQVEALLGDGARFGLSLAYSYDGDTLLGTGGALRRALPLLGDALFVLYGDSYLDCDYTAIGAAFRAACASGKAGLMTVFRNDRQFDDSNVVFRDGQIVRYDKVWVPDMSHIDYGLGALRADVLAAHPAGERFDLARVYQDLIARGELVGYEVSERFYEIGSHAGLADTRALLEGRP